MPNKKTAVIEKGNLADKLNSVPLANESQQEIERSSASGIATPENQLDVQSETASGEPQTPKDERRKGDDKLFDYFDSKEFHPQDFEINVSVDSLESKVGYSSLIRQMHDTFVRRAAFYRSQAGGSCSPDEARARAFHACQNDEQAKEVFHKLMSYPLHNLDLVSLEELYAFAPRVAESVWELIKAEGRAEFESGHLASKSILPVGYMRDAWNIARYLGLRESFIADWQPTGGIEISMIDMLTQAFFQFQYWTEQTVLRSQTRPREEHPDYQQWQSRRGRYEKSWMDGYWFPPYVAEQDAIEHAVQMADRWNRIYLRTLRQLRDLRRYTPPLTINNPQQVNIATDGGQQINVSKTDETESANEAKRITS